MLRLHGPAVYDQWVSHEIPFNDPRVVEVAEFVGSIWFAEGNVSGGRELISQRSFREMAAAHLNGECMMHRQATSRAPTTSRPAHRRSVLTVT